MIKNKAKFKADGVLIWTWLHENPLKEKREMPYDLKTKAVKYLSWCPFCEYYTEREYYTKNYIISCSECPLGDCRKYSWYWKWENAKTIKQSQKYSSLILKTFQEW